jgi:hypothetical protein
MLRVATSAREQQSCSVVAPRWQAALGNALGTCCCIHLRHTGIDEELVALLGQHAPLPVTYAGGARTLVLH